MCVCRSMHEAKSNQGKDASHNRRAQTKVARRRGRQTRANISSSTAAPGHAPVAMSTFLLVPGRLELPFRAIPRHRASTRTRAMGRLGLQFYGSAAVRHARAAISRYLTSDGRLCPFSKLSFLFYPQMAVCVSSPNFHF